MGVTRRSLQSPPQIPPSQRQRILVRDKRTCFVCGRSDRPTDVSHIISLRDGRTYRLSEAQLFHDENLAAICAECNSGQGSERFPLPFFMAVLTLPPSFLAVIRPRGVNEALAWHMRTSR